MPGVVGEVGREERRGEERSGEERRGEERRAPFIPREVEG